jgi:starvation-inducible DNA-binding protein
MITRLKDDNEKVLDTLTKAYELAEEAKKYGISNIIQDRIEAHEKHAWMLRSITKA